MDSHSTSGASQPSCHPTGTPALRRHHWPLSLAHRHRSVLRCRGKGEAVGVRDRRGPPQRLGAAQRLERKAFRERVQPWENVPMIAAQLDGQDAVAGHEVE